MCGIAGFVDAGNKVTDKTALINRMLESIRHRGPEASSFFIEDEVCLGHNRLKIIDLSDEANQPFHYDGLVLIFNGEIYNYIELKETLIKAGFKFRTSSDTEVVCAAYMHWGNNCVDRFIGMWALALWDKRTKKLFCSRDRFGIKPFYYYEQGESFWFGSEIKALKLIPGFNYELNTAQLNRGVAFGWVENHDQTVYTHLKNLPAAHNLIWENGKITVSQYWDIDLNKIKKSSYSWEEKKRIFKDLFFDSVKLHSRSDVANGICLSGGLDSSAIASTFCNLYPEAKIKSFTIYFEGAGKVDERNFADSVVRKYPNIIPHYYQPSNKEVADLWHTAAYQSDVPVWGSSHLAGFFVMGLAKQNGVTVVNDGQGADEYLGGYLHSLYRIMGSQFSEGRIGAAMQLLNGVSSREQFSFGKKMDFLMKGVASAFSDEDKMLKLEYRKFAQLLGAGPGITLERKTEDKFDNFLYHLIFDTTLQPILYFEDRKSMQYSIESRVPFLNHQLIEFAFGLSNEDRISPNAETKYILRESMKDILPKEVYERKDKKGFVTPGEIEWLGGPLNFLMDIDYKKMDWINTNEARTLVEEYKRGNTKNASLVWKLASLDYWLKNFN
ncbi:MAG: asparagine synthase [Bacteroidota bacterium]|nr:asparagine synthase [Bacteroidota bacterium]